MKAHHAPVPRELSGTWRRFGATTRALTAGSMSDDLETLADFLELRLHLFDRLNLPVTVHNSLRMCDCAESGGSLETYLRDVDHFLPCAITDDEELFLSTLAIYFGWRGVTDADARVFDIEAFLRVPHEPHHAAAIGAWLDGTLPWFSLRAALVQDQIAA